jgi:hypothetical protein
MSNLSTITAFACSVTTTAGTAKMQASHRNYRLHAGAFTRDPTCSHFNLQEHTFNNHSPHSVSPLLPTQFSYFYNEKKTRQISPKANNHDFCTKNIYDATNANIFN